MKTELVDFWRRVSRLFKEHRLANKPGWVVLAWDIDDEVEDYHAFHRGERFGMDPVTGRFPNRASAEKYADFRNNEENRKLSDGFGFYVEHETLTNYPLKDTY